MPTAGLLLTVLGLGGTGVPPPPPLEDPEVVAASRRAAARSAAEEVLSRRWEWRGRQLSKQQRDLIQQEFQEQERILLLEEMTRQKFAEDRYARDTEKQKWQDWREEMDRAREEKQISEREEKRREILDLIKPPVQKSRDQLEHERMMQEAQDKINKRKQEMEQALLDKKELANRIKMAKVRAAKKGGKK